METKEWVYVLQYRKSVDLSKIALEFDKSVF
jgi:hypothetical protein